MNSKSSSIIKPVNSTVLTIVVSAFFSVIINAKIWLIYFSSHTVDGIYSALTFVCFFLFIHFLIYSLFSLFNFRYLQKTVYILFFLTSAPAVYFSLKFSVYFDETMLRNMLETDVKEALDLMTFSLVGVFIALGIVPSVLIWRVPVSYKKIWHRLGFNLIQVTLAFVFALAILFPFYGELSSFIRNNNSKLLHSFLPYAPIHSLYQNIRASIKESVIVKEIIDPDARISTAQQTSDNKPLVFVVIVGETARESSFSAHQEIIDEKYGNLLTTKNLLYFNNFWSCGTNTAASVPCMFSTYAKDDFSRDFNVKYENVAEMIQRVGYDVVWRNNNSNCKGICDNLNNDPINLENSKDFFHDKEFYDVALVEHLAQSIAQKQTNQVIFLHQLGSHGPAYYKRVPKAFKILQPACESADFADCSQPEIENAYDNTILYTKHVIARAIDELKTISKDYNTVLLYVSDHGESTGKNGQYLHGIPYFMAPDEQKHVPALIWLSDDYIASKNLNMQCLKAKASEQFSHDNFSHTMLGILDIESKAYMPRLNILDGC